MDDLTKQLAVIVSQWDPRVRLLNIEPITPDASLRRYYRLTITNAECDTIVAMVFDSLSCPEHGQGESVAADRAYVELTNFFIKSGINVPILYYSASHLPVLLIEDLGSKILAEGLIEGGAWRIELPDVGDYFSAALEQIIRIQGIQPSADFFPFQRAFTAATYVHEMLEFKDFIWEDLKLGAKATEELESYLYRLGEKLALFEKVLVHRDFHAWNLIVDSKNSLRVIDFQDALMATKYYDLVSLLNDRDMDSLLGDRRYFGLITEFRSILQCPDNFEEEYYQVLLQRDLKVAGRFAKLSKVRGLKNYEKWIPGTLRRIGRSLAFLANQSREGNHYKSFLSLLSGEIELIYQGAYKK